jgi:hypothetical protein
LREAKDSKNEEFKEQDRIRFNKILRRLFGSSKRRLFEKKTLHCLGKTKSEMMEACPDLIETLEQDVTVAQVKEYQKQIKNSLNIISRKKAARDFCT